MYNVLNNQIKISKNRKYKYQITVITCGKACYRSLINMISGHEMDKKVSQLTEKLGLTTCCLLILFMEDILQSKAF